MDSLKKFTEIILTIFFVSTGVTALILFNVDRRAFTAEIYQQAFASTDFYNTLPADMAKVMLSSTTDASQLPFVMRGMSGEAWEGYFRAMLSQETLKAMGDEVLNSTFTYLNMQTDSIQISLIPLKASMAGESGVQAVYTLLNTQPDCTLEQIAQTTINLLTNSEIQFCNPPANLLPILTPIIQGQMQAVTLVIPDHLTLISAPSQNDPRDKLLAMRMAFRLSPILPLVFLFFLTLLTVNSLRSWLKVWGVSLFIIGFLTGVISLIGAPIFGTILKIVLINRLLASLPALFLDYANNIASTMLQAILNPILWQGLMIALIGLIMIIVSSFIKRRSAT